MIKFPGIGGAAAGALGEAGGIGAQTIGTVLRSPHGGGAQQTQQENTDLSKVVGDLLHDKLMDKMGGGSSPFGGLQRPLGEGGHGPVVHQGGLGGAQSFGGLQLGGHSPMQGAQKENGGLKKLLGDLLQQGGGQGIGQGQQSPQQTENGDLKKLLGDLLKSLTGGQGAAQAQPQQPSGLQGENQDLIKLVADLLKGGGGAQGADDSDSGNDPASMLENLLKQNKQMKSVLGAMQQQTQSPDQLSGALAMTQQMMTQGA